ncbi:MAG: molybdopterin cofactor-binding domain-containing protein [Candidatus Acidiferrales bacterium]
MNAKPNFEIPLEPERYELREAPPYRFETDRRDFFKYLGAGVLILCAAKSARGAQESGGGRRHSGEELPQEIGAWLHVGDSGEVTVFTGKVEVGQNIRTSLSQAVAEELHVAAEKIQMVMGDTQLTPYDRGTYGSQSTPIMNLQLRRAASAARDVLINLAAAQWQVERTGLVAADGRVTDPATKKSVEYAALLKGQQLTETLPAEDPLAPAVEWTIAGRSLSKVDGRDFVTGKHQYPSDQKIPDMLYGKVVRPSAFDATLVSVDTRPAEQIPGVTVVHDGNFVGVAATSETVARTAAAAIRAEWKFDPQPSSKELFEYLKKNTLPRDASGDPAPYQTGSVEAARAAADLHLQQTYTVAYIAHAPLEPRAALAQWNGERLTVWTGTQRPFGVRSELASAFHIPEDQVRVLMPDMGSGYGGKHTGEAAIEAARLARAAKRPVKITWTREEEFTWAYFRPAGVIEISSAMRSDGTVTTWEFHNYNSGAAGIRTYYDVANQKIEFHPTESPLRQGSYRGLAATANHFARESHMDELAHLAGMDPLAFRLRNLKDERLRAVFSAAAQKFGWGRAKTAPEQGFGIAGGFDKGGYLATCAEVSVDRKSGDVKVVRMVAAFECGAIVNPDGLRNQVVGANIMGLGGALFEAIEFENGRILNGRFSKYRLPRFSDVPAIEVVLLDRKDIPSAGAGEAPIEGVAPAIGNAIFDATGVRLRSMPLVPNGLKTA